MGGSKLRYTGTAFETNTFRQKAIVYLESLFLGLLDDLERSTRILNDREIEKGSNKSKGGKPVLVERKRKLDDDDGSADVEDEDGNNTGSDDEQSTRMKAGYVGIEMRLKNRTTG